jgi:hypothetical protein
MRGLVVALGAWTGVVGLAMDCQAGEFVSAVTDYNEGTFATVSGQQYADTSAVIGQPQPLVGAGTAFVGVLTPFNAHYEQDQLAAFGLGGNITLQFSQPMSVTGQPQIGIFTNAAFVDEDYPNGSTGTTATTTAMDEFGAERSAIVEVASHTGVFQSLGRFVFANPTNFYANATGPYQYPAPSPAVDADFNKPFTGGPASFNGDSFSDVMTGLNGSAGGNWISVPTNLGLSDIEYVQLSDPEWEMPDGTLVDSLASQYFPPPDQFIKPADLFLNGAVLIPEPASIGLACLVAFGLQRRRR